jgi:hypothetical protein
LRAGPDSRIIDWRGFSGVFASKGAPIPEFVAATLCFRQGSQVAMQARSVCAEGAPIPEFVAATLCFRQGSQVAMQARSVCAVKTMSGIVK